MTVVDSIKCRFANSGVTDQVGGFQNPGVCLQAFPSFLPHPLPTLLLAPLFSRSLTLVPCSFLLNPTETLVMQAREKLVEVFLRYVSRFYFCISSLLIKPEVGSYWPELTHFFGHEIKFLLV